MGMTDILRQAQQMQSKMAEIQEDLAQRTVEGSSGGGMVRVACTGNQVIRSVSIDPNALISAGTVSPEDVDMLQDLVTAAVNDALRRSRELMETEMKALTGGLKLPFM